MSTILSALRSRRDARLRGDETGFSLIELMIVLLIIAILLAVAIPTYLSARNRAENRAAQETLAHVLVSAQVVYSSQGDYPSNGGTSGPLESNNPGLTFVGPGGVGPYATATNDVGETHGTQYIALSGFAPDGLCFYLVNIESTSSSALSATGAPSGPGTYYGEGAYATPGCTASDAAPTSGWQTTWAAASAKA